MFEKFNKIFETWKKRSSEKLMVLAIYVLLLFINLIVLSLVSELSLFPIKFLNILTRLIIFSTTIIYSADILIKVVTWTNLKPLNKRKIKEKEKITFDSWIGFFIFSMLIIGTEYINFFWTLKTTIKLATKKEKKKYKNKKITGYYWAKIKEGKKTFIECGYLRK